MEDSEEVTVVNARRKSASTNKTAWTEDETSLLISLWSGEDVLFNCRNKDYFKKDARRSAINRILSRLDKEGLTFDELQKKLSSLRTYYGKEIGKERNSKTSGAGTKDVYSSKWPYFSSLHFLRDNITPRKTASNLEGEEMDTELEITLDQEAASVVPADISPEKIIVPVDNMPGSSSKVKKKRASAALEDELLANCLTELKRPRTDASDADSTFAEYVCNQLRKIPEGYSKEILKLEIQRLIVKVMLPTRQPLSTIAFEDLENTFQ